MEELLSFAAALVSLRLAAQLLQRFRARREQAYAVWGAGLVAYAAASAALAWSSAAGWSNASFRVYYLCGGLLAAALLGCGSLLRAGHRFGWPLALAYGGLAVGVALAMPVHGGFDGTAIPAAQAHLSFFPARLLAIVGNSLGTLSLAGFALLSLRRRLLGNGLILAGVAVAAAGSGLSGLGVTRTALFSLVAALLLYGGFVAPSPRRTAAAAGVVAATLALLLVAGCGGHAKSVTPKAKAKPTPARLPPFEESCLTKGERAHVIKFASASKATIAGVVVGTGKRGLVLVHQSGDDLCQWVPYARRFAKLGYRSLALDLNANGGSTSAPGSPSDNDWSADIAAAAGVLRGQGVDTVELMGASLGGTVVVAAAPTIQPPVAAVVDLSGPTDLSGSDALAAAPKLRVPTLFMAARQDDFAISVREVAAHTPARYRTLKLVPGSAHGVALINAAILPEAPRYLAFILRFLNTYS